MSRQRSRDTTPELKLRRALHRRGIRYRLHVIDLPGRPDIVLVRPGIAVFVDGCFWHRCPSHGVLPKANAAWWLAKLSANTERDRRNDQDLVKLGWDVRRVWEHEDTEAVADELEARWQASG